MSGCQHGLPARTIIEHASIYDGLCSSIGNSQKLLFADDTLLPQDARFARITVKCRTIGTNTYIGIGTNSRNLRFTAAVQSMTFKAPIVNGSIVPLNGTSLTVVGDVSGGAGVLEISGIRIYYETQV